MIKNANIINMELDFAQSLLDGFNRHYFVLPFVSALLGSIGVPCLLHGVEAVGPKYGITPFKLLQSAGLNPLKSINDVSHAIETPSIGWGYCDQTVYSPLLSSLIPLRHAMVKRPILATIEKFLLPILATNDTHLITGYTHPPYRQTTDYLLSQLPALSKRLICRGTEGSCQLPLDRRAPTLFLNKNENISDFVRPTNYGIDEQDRFDPIPEISCDNILHEGVLALQGIENLVYSMILYQSMVILDKFDKYFDFRLSITN